MSTSFTRLVGCEVPIQQAPIGFAAALPELPLAVAAAGGHGMLAGVRMPASDLAERLRSHPRAARARSGSTSSSRCWTTALETAAAHAPLVELYLGEPTPALVARARGRRGAGQLADHLGRGGAGRRGGGVRHGRGARDRGRRAHEEAASACCRCSTRCSTRSGCR